MSPVTPTASQVVTVTVNGERVEKDVPARRLLVHFLRDDLDLTGTHIGCDTGSCGACTVHLDGVAGEELRGARRAGGRRSGHDGRRACRRRAVAAPALVPRAPRAPVRLLHAGDADERERAPRGEPEPERGRGQGRAAGQHLPLHRLLEHRRGRVVAGREGRSDPRDRRRDRRTDDHPPEGLRRPERAAAGGPPPRPGPGPLLRRRQAARDGLPALRALAVRARADRVGRRQRGARAARRLRDADRRRGRDPHRPVLPDRGRPGRPGEGLRARGRQGALHRRGGRRRRRRDARARARRGRARRWSSTSRSTSSSTRARRSRTARRCSTRSAAGTCPTPASGSGATSTPRSPRPTTSSRSPSSTSTASTRRRSSSTAALVEYNRGTGPVDDHDEQPVPRVRRDHDGARDAGRHRQAAHRHAGHRRRLRQQDHVAPAARRLLPARAQAEPPDPVDRVADGLPPVDVARERALVPRHRGRRQGRRDDDRVPDEGDRRRGRLPPLRAARRRDLVAGRARDVRLAEHPRRVHAGDDEQGAGLAEPRLLAHAAPLAHRADRRHRRAGARLRPRRAAEEELRPARADAVRDAERLRLRLRRLPEGARHRARADRLRHDRGSGARRPRRAASCSASGSARRSTPGRTTSASRSS